MIDSDSTHLHQPAEVTSSPGESSTTPTSPEGRSDDTSGSCLRVLVVDDHAVMRQALSKMMANHPAMQVVGEAVNGREAIEKVDQLQPDVVLMDVSMPEMDGIEATARIKQAFPAIRVVGISMYDEEGIARQMQQAGADAFFCKTAPSIKLLNDILGK